MDDLIAFLRARLDHDERHIAELRALSAEDQGLDGPWKPEGHDPVLIDLAAKRRIIELHTPRQRHDGDLECPTCVYTGEDEDAGGNRFRYREHEDAPCETLCLLALPYAEHPDYRKEWIP